MKSLEDTIVYLIKKEPFYAHLLANLIPVEDKRVPVAGYSINNNKIYLHLHFDVFNQLTMENRTKVLIHELLHIILGHSQRQKNKIHDLWGIACDITINQMIEGIPIKQKVKIPKEFFNTETGKKEKKLEEKELGGLTYDNIILANGKKLNLPPNEFAEKYYNLLLAKAKEAELGIDNFHPTWDDSNNSPDELIDALIKNIVIDALGKSQGNIPMEVETYIDRLIKTKTPWKRILKLFIAKKNNYKHYLTYKKQNKRFINEGLPGYKKTKKLKVILAVDTSASIEERDLSAFCSEITKINKCDADVMVIECDSKVQKVYKPGKKFDFKYKGRGGTDFRPVWDYIEKNKLKPDLIIYLTDGQGQAPQFSKYPTLWLLTPEGERPWMLNSQGKKEVVNWGKFIKINI